MGAATTIIFWYFLVIAPGDWHTRVWGAFMNQEKCEFYQKRVEAAETDKHVSQCIQADYTYSKVKYG